MLNILLSYSLSYSLSGTSKPGNTVQCLCRMEDGVNSDPRPHSRNLISTPLQRYHAIPSLSYLSHPAANASKSSRLNTQSPQTILPVNEYEERSCKSLEDEVSDGGKKQNHRLPSRTAGLVMVTSTADKRPTAPSLRWNAKGNTSSHSLWTARTHLRPTRSVSSPPESKRFNSHKTANGTNTNTVVGKPSVKNLLRRFDPTSDAGKGTTGVIPTDAKLHHRSSPPSPNSRNPARLRTEISQTNNEANISSGTSQVDEAQITADESNLYTSNTVKNPPNFHRPLFGEVIPAPDGSYRFLHGVSRGCRSTSDPSIQPHDIHPTRPSFTPTAWYFGNVELRDRSCDQTPKRIDRNTAETQTSQRKINDVRYPKLSTSVSSTPVNFKLPIVSGSVDGVFLHTESSGKSSSHIRDEFILGQSPGDSPHVTQISTLKDVNMLSVRRHPPATQSSRRTPSRYHVKSKSLEVASPRARRTEVTRKEKEKQVNSSVQERIIPNVALESVDFVARRETIQRAYTNRLKNDEHSQVHTENMSEELLHLLNTEENVLENSEPQIDLTASKSLHVETMHRKAKISEDLRRLDSPTLGVPGSYIEDDEPLSADSNLTVIDIEPQTEATSSRGIQAEPKNLSAQDDDPEVECDCEIALVKSESREKHTANCRLTNLENYLPGGATSKDDLFKYDPSLPGAFHDDVPVLFPTITNSGPPTPPTPPIAPLDISLDSQSIFLKLENSQRENIDDNFHSDKLSVARNPCLHDLKYQLPDILTTFQACSDSGDIHTPLTEKFYEASESGVGDPEILDFIGVRDEISKRSSILTEESIEISSNFNELNVPTIGREFSLSSREEQPTMDTKIPRKLPVATLTRDKYSPPLSPCIQPASGGPLLPPVATGEDFTLTFSKNSSMSSNIGPIHSWPPDYSPPPPPTFQRSASSPMENLFSSPIVVSSRSFTGTYSPNPNGRLLGSGMISEQSSSSTPRLSPQISLKGTEVLANLKENEADKCISREDKQINEEDRKRLYQRMMAVKELIDTEAVYLKDMNVVEEIYKGTAEACPNLEVGDIKTIFRNTEEIVSFSNTFLEDLKVAALPIYTPRKRNMRTSAPSTVKSSPDTDRFPDALTLNDETEEQKDRKTFIGAVFCNHLSSMRMIYTDFLKNSENASSRLLDLQKDPAVKVWLSECNTVAKDLTAAWDLDALLVKPVQRITRYQLLLKQIQASTPENHPDSKSLTSCCHELSNLLKNIDELKKRINVVAKIVGRKRKESDVVRTGIAKAFGRRTEKPNTNPHRLKDDEDYLKIFEKFADDYVRLQVVLRDAEYYSRQVSTHVSDYLRYLSIIESMIRVSTTGYFEIESKWIRFNASMRETGTNLVEEHMFEIKKLVIEPFEKTITAYDGPLLAMKKRDKRKIDYDKATSLRSQGKKVDEKLQNLSNEYSALHETLKWELPKLSELTEKMGNLILGNLISIQQKWYSLWMDKVQSLLEENQLPTDIPEIIAQFQRDYKYHEARLLDLSIVNGSLRNEDSLQPARSKSRSRRVSDVSSKAALTMVDSMHSKRSSINLNAYRNPSNSALQLTPTSFPISSPGDSHLRGIANLPREKFQRPDTGQSFNSESGLRASHDYSTTYRGESQSAPGSYYETPSHVSRPPSGIFNSAMPMEENGGNNDSRFSYREKTIPGGYNILYLAASLFEFNISATKQEAGYIYLTYQAGEIFDVIGEKGELWLAKNQDDATNTVGWIWSKHFARLAAN